MNLEAHGNRDSGVAEQALDAVSRRIAARGWSIQVFASIAVVAALKDAVLELPVPLILDHFGGARAEAGVDQPGFAAVVEMLKSGQVYLKLSAPYRASSDPNYKGLTSIVRAFIAAAPDRLVWASDWPHTGGGAIGSDERKGRGLSDIEPFRQVDVQRVLALLAEWSDDAKMWHRILVDNPARLYNFT
jgi:predicted TIM-barrel fold metal-dependent hydrolase